MIYRNYRASGRDSRDHVFPVSEGNLRESVDLREWDSAIEDQGSIGSCVAEAITSAYEIMLRTQQPPVLIDLSRMFLYYNARYLDGILPLDAGTDIRTGLRAGYYYGICLEELWPYVPANLNSEPPPAAYEEAQNHVITEYWSLAGNQEIRQAINTNRPVVIGSHIYSGFLTVDSANPTIPMPAAGDYYEGGHAMVIVGYDISDQRFLVKNSFGTNWGMAGYCWMPFDYAEQYVFERWCFDIGTAASLQTPRIQLPERTIVKKG